MGLNSNTVFSFFPFSGVSYICLCPNRNENISARQIIVLIQNKLSVIIYFFNFFSCKLFVEVYIKKKIICRSSD